MLAVAAGDSFTGIIGAIADDERSAAAVRVVAEDGGDPVFAEVSWRYTTSPAAAATRPTATTQPARRGGGGGLSARSSSSVQRRLFTVSSSAEEDDVDVGSSSSVGPPAVGLGDAPRRSGMASSEAGASSESGASSTRPSEALRSIRLQRESGGSESGGSEPVGSVEGVKPGLVPSSRIASCAGIFRAEEASSLQSGSRDSDAELDGRADDLLATMG